MAQINRNNVAFIKRETSYGSEAGSTNGSDMTYVELADAPSYTDELSVGEAPVQTGRLWRNPSVALTDGATIEVKVYWPALSGAASSGIAPAADDYLDILLQSWLGPPQLRSGHLITSASTNVYPSTGGWGGHSLQDVVGVFGGTSVSPSRLQTGFLSVSSSATSATIMPSWESPPPANSVSYGNKTYLFNAASGTQLAHSFTMTISGASTPAVVGGASIPEVFTFTGCRVVSAKLDAPTSQLVSWTFTIKANAKVEESATKTALPTIARSQVPFIKMMASPLFMNDTKQSSVQAASVDFGLMSQEVKGQEANQGRSDIGIFGLDPSLSVQPLRQNSYVDAKRSQTASRVLLQVGSGVPTTVGATTYVPCGVVHMNEAQIVNLQETVDDKIERQTLTYKVSDVVSFSGSAARAFQIVRF